MRKYGYLAVILYPLTLIEYKKEKQRTANTGLAKVAVQCSAEAFVVNQTLVLRINIRSENRHLRQARNRYKPF